MSFFLYDKDAIQLRWFKSEEGTLECLFLFSKGPAQLLRKKHKVI